MKKFQKGFTLMELLIVIAILGVLAGLVWTALDPLDKINSANDAKSQSDIGVYGQSEEAYATAHNAYYTDDTGAPAALVAAGEIKAALPTTTTFYAPAGCTADGTVGCANIVVCTPLLSKKFNATAATGVFVYSSASGKACVKAIATQCAAITAATTCP